ncbi:GH21303 [Drosophila grimshawi]|uniref:GH21303 n=1 Tax=Drosophila grimshawi TaxID=7222 RepID=B4J867_DROGR|nr:GH21303 [Drosophila grimshawi]
MHAYTLIFVTQLLLLTLYTKQNKFQFTLGIGVIIICTVIGLSLVGAYFMGMFSVLLTVAAWLLEPWYIIYDTHCQLTGQHRYRVGPQEYLFAATNIYADIPKSCWLILKSVVLGPFIMLVKIMRHCRTRQVC